jgi:N-carbamoylputrescine amidase
MIPPLKVSLWQHSYIADPDALLHQVSLAMQDASKAGCQIFCLQELFHAPYFCREIKEAFFNYAITTESALVKEIGALAHRFNLYCIAPIFEKRAPGIFHNTALFINPEGSIQGLYRKVHLPMDPSFYEKYYFTPGDTGFPVFETPWGKIGVLICWDQWFPEAARILALQGVSMIFYPTAIGLLPGEEDQLKDFHNAWKIMQQSHAIANGIYIASVNRVGQEGDTQFWGRSFITDPWGRILAEAGGEESTGLSAALDPALIEQIRITWPFLRDRRPDCYEGLLQHFHNNPS